MSAVVFPYIPFRDFSIAHVFRFCIECRIVLTAASAQGVRLVVALAKAGGTLRYNPSSVFKLLLDTVSACCGDRLERATYSS